VLDLEECCSMTKLPPALTACTALEHLSLNHRDMKLRRADVGTLRHLGRLRSISLSCSGDRPPPEWLAHWQKKLPRVSIW